MFIPRSSAQELTILSRNRHRLNILSGLFFCGSRLYLSLYFLVFFSQVLGVWQQWQEYRTVCQNWGRHSSTKLFIARINALMLKHLRRTRKIHTSRMCSFYHPIKVFTTHSLISYHNYGKHLLITKTWVTMSLKANPGRVTSEFRTAIIAFSD